MGQPPGCECPSDCPPHNTPHPRELTRPHPGVALALGGCPGTVAGRGSSEPRHLEWEG